MFLVQSKLSLVTRFNALGPASGRIISLWLELGVWTSAGGGGELVGTPDPTHRAQQVQVRQSDSPPFVETVFGLLAIFVRNTGETCALKIVKSFKIHTPTNEAGAKHVPCQ